MKSLLFFFSIVFMTQIASAQTKADSATKSKPSKAEKAEQKAKQESDLMSAFQAAGLNEVQITSAKSIIADASQKMNELKKKNELTDEAKKVINDEKNEKLKQLMGENSFKKFNTARKNQKKATNQQ